MQTEDVFRVRRVVTRYLIGCEPPLKDVESALNILDSELRAETAQAVTPRSTGLVRRSGLRPGPE